MTKPNSEIGWQCPEGSAPDTAFGSIETLILVSGDPVLFTVILDDGWLDHQIVSYDLVRPTIRQ